MPEAEPSRRRLRVVRRGATGLLALAVAVEILSRTGLVPNETLPPASTTLVTAAGLLADPAFLVHVGGTLLAWAIGLGLAVVIGVGAGIGLGVVPRAADAASATVELLRPIPSVALIPIAILLVGRGLDMKVVLAAYAATWPILVSTLAGVRATDPVALDTARAYGLRGGAIVRHVVLPSAAPYAMSGIRVAAAIALIVVVSAELLAGGGSGIGTWMLGVSGAGVARELLYAGIVVTGLLGLAVTAVVDVGERRLVGWHRRPDEPR